MEMCVIAINTVTLFFLSLVLLFRGGGGSIDPLDHHLPGKHADIHDVTVPGCPRSYV